MSDFGTRFGALVAAKREERGWSLAQLAVAAYGDDGQGGETRKSDVLKLEQGRSSKPNARTVKRYREALGLTQAEIDGCRTKAEVELARFAEHLFEVIAAAVAQTDVSDDLAAELAESRAAGNPDDFDGALRELRQALEVAAEQKARGVLPSNLPDAVDEIVARVDALNREGQVTEAGQALKSGLAAARDKAAEAQAGVLRLLEAGVAQAVLERSVPDAAGYLLERLRIDAAGPGTFDALRAVQDDWYERGRDKGLAFDLEVSIALAEAAQGLARNADERGAALVGLAASLQTLGAWESGTDRLEAAVAAYRAAPEEITRERVPLDWARTQLNLGNALQTLGARESGTDRLEAAVAAYRAALEERTRERVPLDWAMTQMNLGNALQTLGERESGTDRLEAAVAAYREALQEVTRERVPLDWARTQMNLGNALRTLGERESGTDRLKEAVAAYRAALEEHTRERVPLGWAMLQGNLANVELAFFDKTGDAARLAAAERHVQAARDVFVQAGASQYVGVCDNIMEKIAQRRAAG